MKFEYSERDLDVINQSPNCRRADEIDSQDSTHKLPRPLGEGKFF